MDEYQIKICCTASDNHIDYYWYDTEMEKWGNLAEDNYSPFSKEEYLSASIEEKATDIYKEIMENYYDPIYGIRIIFVGNENEFHIMKAALKKDFSKYGNIELEFEEPQKIQDVEEEDKYPERMRENPTDTLDREANEKEAECWENPIGTSNIAIEEECWENPIDTLNIPIDMEEEESSFSMGEWTNLLGIMKSHGVIRTKEGYEELTEACWSVRPDSYLGKMPDTRIYFTTTALYVRDKAGSWVCMLYEDLRLDRVQYEKRIREYKFTIPVSRSKSCTCYLKDEESARHFRKLLYDVNGAHTSSDDEYVPILFHRENDICSYMEILIDFLKLSHRDTMAALVKCSEAYMGLEAENVFWIICEYARSAHEVSLMSMKKKVLKWKKNLDADERKLRTAILYKDLVEIQQLSAGRVYSVTPLEKTFLDWLAEQADVKEKENFLEMVSLPYALMSKADHFYKNYEKILEIISYAEMKQTDIPWQILNNETLGFWSCLKYFINDSTFDRDEILNVSASISYSRFYAYLFVLYDVLYLMSDDYHGCGIEMEQMRKFMFGCNLQESVFESLDLAELGNDEEWIMMCQRIFEHDRRDLGLDIFRYFLNYEA